MPRSISFVERLDPGWSSTGLAAGLLYNAPKLPDQPGVGQPPLGLVVVYRATKGKLTSRPVRLLGEAFNELSSLA